MIQLCNLHLKKRKGSLQVVAPYLASLLLLHKMRKLLLLLFLSLYFLAKTVPPTHTADVVDIRVSE